MKPLYAAFRVPIRLAAGLCLLAVAGFWLLAVVLQAQSGHKIDSLSTGPRTQGGMPSAGACGTSPLMTAGSTDTVGEIRTGSDGPAACAVSFASAWPTAPRCIANVNTATAANARAIGVTSTTTTLTLTPASAFVAADKVWWLCLGPK